MDRRQRQLLEATQELEALHTQRASLEEKRRQLVAQDRACWLSVFYGNLALMAFYFLHLLVGAYRDYYHTQDDSADVLSAFSALIVLLLLRQLMLSDSRAMSFSLTVFALSQLYLYIMMQGREDCQLELAACLAMELQFTLDLLRFGSYNSVPEKVQCSSDLMAVKDSILALQKHCAALSPSSDDAPLPH